MGRAALKAFKKWKDALAAPLEVERLVLDVKQLPRVRWPATKPLPPEIGRFVNLRELRIRARNLSGLCSELATLPKLESLEIDNPEMEPFAFGDVLAAMPALKVLDLYNTHLKEPIALPPTLEELVIEDETVMDLGHWLSHLSGLPKLRRLSMMQVSGWVTATQPLGLSRLSGLTELCLGSNSLTEQALLWDELAELQGLQCLRIHANKLRRVPPSIRGLAGLKTLRLDHNAIEELPQWLGDLQCLEELGLSVMPLRDLPPSLLQLPLKRLFVDVPDEVYAMLETHLPDCEISRRNQGDLDAEVDRWLRFMGKA